MARIRGDIRRYRIFALIEPDLDMAYIGKTCSKSLDSQRRAHMRGDIECTRDVFGPEAVDPDMDYFILEILDCTIVDAYKHVLAWYRYFLEHGYDIVLKPAAQPLHLKISLSVEARPNRIKVSQTPRQQFLYSVKPMTIKSNSVGIPTKATLDSPQPKKNMPTSTQNGSWHTKLQMTVRRI